MEVLVVDDDPFIRAMLAELLEDEGYRVTSAGDGQEALTCLRKGTERPCVILLDLMMPRLDGWGFRAVQRQDPALAPIPVVTISAHADMVLEPDALDAAAHLPKPLDMNYLLATIARICSHSLGE